jgi:hypothetical protein
MKNDFDHTSHPTDQLLDPEKTDKTDALIQMKFPHFLCVYPSMLVQESPSKFEMNYNLMVHNYIHLIGRRGRSGGGNLRLHSRYIGLHSRYIGLV